MNSDIYKGIVQYNELLKLSETLYMMVGYDLVFDYSKGVASVYGAIPMELASEVYEKLKDSKERVVSNYPGGLLVDPVSFAFHNELTNFEKSMSHLKIIEFLDVVKKKREELVKSDYDNCYIKIMRFYNADALEYFIKTVRDYYSNKNGNRKILS